MTAHSPDNAELIIGDLPGALPDLNTVTIDIGNMDVFKTVSYLSGIGYNAKVPSGAEGPLRLRKDGRIGPALQLLTWNPKLKVSDCGPHKLAFEVTFNMRARAIPATRQRSGKVGPLSWDPPQEAFEARFDAGGSVVSWSVSGGETVSNVRYNYSGGGSQNLTFQQEGVAMRAEFNSSDGKAVRIDFGSDVQLTYTETITNLVDGSSTVNSKWLVIDQVFTNGQLESDWTLKAGEDYFFFAEQGWDGDLTWTAARPSPPYDPETMRR